MWRIYLPNRKMRPSLVNLQGIRLVPGRKEIMLPSSKQAHQPCHSDQCIDFAAQIQGREEGLLRLHLTHLFLRERHLDVE